MGQRVDNVQTNLNIWSGIMGQRIDNVHTNSNKIWSEIMGQRADIVQINLKYGLKLWDKK